MSALEFTDIWKSFGAKPVLQGLSATLPMTGITFVVGKSGSGKSVLCRLAVGLTRPDRGVIHSLGREVTALPERQLIELRAQTPYVVQGPALLDALTVEENIALAGRDLDLEECQNRTARAISQLGLKEWAHRYPPTLGPGIKKRAAIARALVLKPRYLLLDEPTTGLDKAASQQVNEAIVLLKTLGLGALVVSHDYDALKRIADSVLVLGNGRQCFWGSKEGFLESAVPEVVELREP